jgi:hypothetical protein
MSSQLIHCTHPSLLGDIKSYSCVGKGACSKLEGGSVLFALSIYLVQS